MVTLHLKHVTLCCRWALDLAAAYCRALQMEDKVGLIKPARGRERVHSVQRLHVTKSRVWRRRLPLTPAISAPELCSHQDVPQEMRDRMCHVRENMRQRAIEALATLADDEVFA